MTNFEELVPELYRTAGAKLAAYGFALTGSRADAEDLVQDAVVKTFVRHRKLEDVSHAIAYVRVTMRTLHVDRLRRDASWRRLVVRLAPPDEAPGDDDIDGRDAVERAIAGLAPRVRTVVALRLYDDLTLGAIANAMGISEGTVKKYLQEARIQLASVCADPHSAFELDDSTLPLATIAVVPRRSR